MILNLRKGSESPRTVSLNRPQALLGKHSECDLVLADPKVSRRHALITEEGGKIFIEDLGSTNGTAVAGQVTSGRVAVGPEDAIEIGPFVLSVRAGTAAASEANVTRTGGADKTRMLSEAPAPPKAQPPSRPELATGATRILPAGSVPKAAAPSPKAGAVPPQEAATRIETPAASQPASAATRPAAPAAPRPPMPPPSAAAPAARRPSGTIPAVSLGPLDAFASDKTITEMMVNGPDEIFIERDGRLELTPARFPSEQALRELVGEIATAVGRTIDERRPMLEARLRDGSRVHAVIPPAALRGTYLTIRLPREPLTAEQLVSNRSLSQPMLDFLRAAVSGRTSLLVSGGTGSGRTTLLSALCAFLGPEERIITIEDAAELSLSKRHVLPLEGRRSDGGDEVTMRDLVRNALRMRPDRIVVGELRGGEALDLLQAMSAGHEGSLSTIQASSTRDALARLETLIHFASDLPSRAVRQQIAAAVRLVVHSERVKGGKRRVKSIAEVSGLEGDELTTEEIFVCDEEGEFDATGYTPRLRDRLVEQGIAVEDAWFRQAEGKRN